MLWRRVQPIHNRMWMRKSMWRLHTPNRLRSPMGQRDAEDHNHRVHAGDAAAEVHRNAVRSGNQQRPAQSRNGFLRPARERKPIRFRFPSRETFRNSTRFACRRTAMSSGRTPCRCRCKESNGAVSGNGATQRKLGTPPNRSSNACRSSRRGRNASIAAIGGTGGHNLWLSNRVQFKLLRQ